MKIFNWMQNKFNGKERKTKPDSALAAGHIKPQACKEEFSDWPNGLFSIGTFGNNTMKHTEDSNLFSCQDQPKADNLQDINSLTSLEHDQSPDEWINGDSADKDSHLQRTTSVYQSKESDVRLHSTANGIGRKSLSFLLKKTLLCGGGIPSTPVLRDPFPEAKLDKSILEKILGALLQKKIYPQSSTQMAAAKKFLDMPESDSDNDRSKWDKTDSEYIVLEI